MLFISTRYGNFMYVFGGYDGRMIYNDLHRLDLQTFAWESVETSGEGPLALGQLRPGIYPTCTPAGIVLGNKAVVLCEDFIKSTAALFVLHLKEMRWQR